MKSSTPWFNRLAAAVLLLGAAALAAAPLTFYSTTATVGTTSSTIVAAAQNYQALTVQNTHASNNLYLSFTCPATTSDLKLTPGTAVWFAQAPSNALCAVASGAGTTVSILGGKQ